MVRQVAEKLASLFRDEKIQVICILGGPYVGKTWLVNHIYRTEKNDSIRIFDNVNTYDELEEIIAKKRNGLEKYVIVGRLDEERCKAIVGSDIVVEYLMLYPMNFREFRLAVPVSYNICESKLLKLYMLVGGLPDVVKTFVQTGDINSVRQKQCQLFEEINSKLTAKAQNVINEVIRQELSEGTGFCIRQIDKNAREREYAKIIEELVSDGLIEKVERYAPGYDIDARKYRLKFFDIGIYSMINDLQLDKICGRGEDWNKDLLYDFYSKVLRTYIDRKVETIKYWKKNRAKAKIHITIERLQGEKRVIAISLIDKKKSISRSAMSFEQEYPASRSINVCMPTLDKVTDGYELYSKICHNT